MTNSTKLIRIDDLDTPIYRIFPLNRLQEVFENEELVLVRPKLWDDPFENFLRICHGVTNSGDVYSFDRLETEWFGQCWTTNADTDAMWRIYSHDKQSVRVKTTARKLSEAVYNKADPHAFENYFLGRVQYKSRADIESLLGRVDFTKMAFYGQNIEFAEALLIKRTEFDHEAEIRALVHHDVRANGSKQGDIYRVPITTKDFIDEVCIDPRMSDEFDIECITKKILRMGYDKDVIQSQLYKIDLSRIPQS